MSFEEVADNLFRIEVPLPDNPLRYLNAYLIRAGSSLPTWRGRNLLIDSGFNRKECLDAILHALDALGVRPDTLDLFVTHLHADHCGLTSKLMTMAGKSAWALAGIRDGAHINMHTRQTFRITPGSEAMLGAGLPADMVESMTSAHPGMRYATDSPCAFTPVKDGDVLPYGDYALRVLETPGHTPGQLCLYDKNKKVLFSSDHILGDITPNISTWEGIRDSLGDYLKSLEKTEKLDVDLCLTGHRSILSDCKGRIAALKRHHAARLEEVLNILDQVGESPASKVAANMTWSVRAKRWEEFPPAQKWFACGEALAHLSHLQARKYVRSRKQNGLRLFSRIK